MKSPVEGTVRRVEGPLWFPSGNMYNHFVEEIGKDAITGIPRLGLNVQVGQTPVLVYHALHPEAIGTQVRITEVDSAFPCGMKYTRQRIKDMRTPTTGEDAKSTLDMLRIDYKGEKIILPGEAYRKAIRMQNKGTGIDVNELIASAIDEQTLVTIIDTLMIKMMRTERN